MSHLSSHCEYKHFHNNESSPMVAAPVMAATDAHTTDDYTNLCCVTLNQVSAIVTAYDGISLAHKPP